MRAPAPWRAGIFAVALERLQQAENAVNHARGKIRAVGSNASGFQKMDDGAKTIIRFVLASVLLTPLSPAAAAPTEPVTLICTMQLVPKEGGTRGDVTYAVDFDKNTVNGGPATITENSIEIVKEMPWGKATTRINRVTGGAQWLNGDGILANGECVKAPPPRRF